MNLDRYKVVSLAEILEHDSGEAVFNDTIQDFACPLNEDVEHFLKHSAIPNHRMSISRTSLVFLPRRDTSLLVGYYSLALQVLDLNRITSKSLRKKITGFKRENKLGAAVYLIGQLGKNFNQGANHSISGQELFMLAVQDILEANRYVGGRILIVECKNEEHLRKFYEDTLNLRLIDTADDESMLKYMALNTAYDIDL